MSDTTPSGRFVLRLDPSMHAALRSAAAEAGLSLNEYCVRKLASPGFALDPAVELVHRTMTVVGGPLIGIIVFGSWARSEAGPQSDVDLLVVVDHRLELARELYEQWDRAPVTWDDRRVEPHFVHLPGISDRISGLWAEVALDGLVVFERGLELSKSLADLRRRIVEGGWIRRHAGGQPYWVEVA